MITTFAGNGTPTFAGDGGPATAASLYLPAGIAVDGAGNVYIADVGNSRIREVSAVTGFITTVAGNATSGFAGDGGLATAASLNLPFGVAVDSAGNLYIGDFGNDRVRKVTAATGIITTIGGNGAGGFGGTPDNGTTPATSAAIDTPQGVAVDAGGNVYINDYDGDRIRKITAATGFISTVAGDLAGGYTASQDTGTTAATATSINGPAGAAVDSAGNLYVVDQLNNRIRKVTAAAAPLKFANTNVNATSATQTVTVNNAGNASLTFAIPGTGQNPSLSSNFTLGNSSTCITLTNSSSNSVSLAAGASCNEVLSYSPTITGSVTGNLIFTDNNLNATNATQTVVLTGATASTLTVSVVGQNVPQGTSSITLEFTVGYGGNTAPTGTPTLTVNGSATNVGAVACRSKAGHLNCTATYNPSSLTPGAYTITATQPADATPYAQTSATGTLTIIGSPGSQVARPVHVSAPVAAAAPGFAVRPVQLPVPLLVAPGFNLDTTSDFFDDSSTKKPEADKPKQ